MDPRYSQIHSQIWGDEKFAALSEGDKLLFLYLLTSPHCNMVGYYRLPLAYAAADLGWDAEKVADGLTRLSPMVEYDRAASVVFIRHFLLYNPVKGAKQDEGARRQARTVPKSRLWGEFIDAAREYAPGLAKLLDTPSILHQEGIDTVSIGIPTSPVRSQSHTSTKTETPPYSPPTVDNYEGESAVAPQQGEDDLFSGLMRTVGDRDIDLDFEAAIAMEREIIRRRIPLRVVEIAADLTVDLCDEPRARGTYFQRVIRAWLQRGIVTIPAAERDAERARQKAKLRAGPPRARSGTR